MSNMTEREKNALQTIHEMMEDPRMDDEYMMRIAERTRGYLDAKEEIEARQNRAS